VIDDLQRFIVDSNRRFLTEDGDWTFDDSKGITFDDIAALLKTCSQNGLQDAHILLRFQDNEPLEVTFAISH
jgi:hypothetical protein